MQCLGGEYTAAIVTRRWDRCILTMALWILFVIYGCSMWCFRAVLIMIAALHELGCPGDLRSSLYSMEFLHMCGQWREIQILAKYLFCLCLDTKWFIVCGWLSIRIPGWYS
jgi:hypothetical protein